MELPVLRTVMSVDRSAIDFDYIELVTICKNMERNIQAPLDAYSNLGDMTLLS